MRYLTEQYIRMQTMLSDKKGATMVEYSLLVALISIAAIAVLPNIGPKILAAFTAVDGAMPAGAP